jgi:RNA polymerase sigma-70 factor (ECF subfamily)
MPIETGGDDATAAFEPIAEQSTIESRYDLMESASLAFLQALEALTPTQRAVLLLRDVFDYSAAEVAGVLDTSEGNVRLVHHRARRAMESYDRRRSMPPLLRRQRTDRALQRFLALLSAGDVHGIERMLATDVRTVTDANGEFTALFHPLVGAPRVAKFFAQFAESRRSDDVAISIREINGVPWADIEIAAPRGRRPPRLLLGIDLDDAGDIANIWIVASAAKLVAVPPLRAGHVRLSALEAATDANLV